MRALPYNCANLFIRSPGVGCLVSTVRVLAFAGALICSATAQVSSNALGLAVTISTADGKSHTTSVSNLALYVAKGEAPTPFVAPGPFTAVFEGNVHADLRGEFSFQAELNGTFDLEINAKTALSTSLTNGTSSLSKPTSLNKGANKLKATYTTPKTGDAYLRVSWNEKGTNTSPIPPQVLSHSAPSRQLELGRELFLEHRCANCHVENPGVPELAMDAPSFDGIGLRRKPQWMVRWILDPKAERASARMPKLAKSADEAHAMAAFLSSLMGQPRISQPKERKDVPSPEGKTLYEALLCATCHDASDPAKISLTHVAEKFPRGKLAEYLLAPEAHFAWTRMPNFKLSQNEAHTLARELLGGQDVPVEPPPDKSLIDTGRTLVQSRGCLNCHDLSSSEPAAKSAIKKINDWSQGCLGSSSNAPQFTFATADREALQAFGRSGLLSLTRHVPAEFAERQTRVLNCRGCHGQQEAFPPLDILGAKLRPEWSGPFIAGEIAYKPRAETHPRGEPWLFARMPSFKSRAHLLAHGMAALHGYPPKTPPALKVDPELVKHGQKLIGKEGGFSCVSCHAVGMLPATDVFDSEGINLVWSAERLLPQYYRRWVRNPLGIDPQTKMPVYFDEEGRSPLTEILDGDGEKQLTAIWHYLLLGDKMPAPNAGEVQ